MVDNRNIRLVLQDALEEEIPSSQVKLWPAVKASLVAGNQVQQGEKMNHKKVNRLRRLALASAVLVALLAVTSLTPQGRALSQTVWQFFTQAESSALPVQPPPVVPSEPDGSVPTAAPPAPLTSIAEAEAQVGFDVAELPYVPNGFNYLGARLYGNAVSIEYETPSRDGHLIIMQSQEGFVQSQWDRVPAEAIVPVKIGELDAEFTRGMFAVYAGEMVATWNPDAPILRLRWVQDGVWFEMTKSGNAKTIEYLDQAHLVELAESLIAQP
jgi:hypothetical protein